jgi:formylglycine-generating enzyme required for sulfatase activity
MRKHASVESKGVIVLLLIAAGIVAVSCGGTEPSDPDLTASILSLEFTGDSSKIGTDFRSGVLQQALSFSVTEASDGSKGVCEVTATWTICPEGSFDSYALYRSETPGISSSPSSAEVLAVFTDANANMYIDVDVDWATKYYYALQTSDADNNTVWSNEASLTTPGTAPTPSILAVDYVSTPEVDLSWSQCPDSDFDSYRLYRSDSPNIESDTTFAERIYTGTAVGNTVYTDTDVHPDSTYYYALMTTNTKNCSSWSNELEIITPPFELPEGMEFASIPSGSFEMGSPESDPDSYDSERPVHTVTFNYSFEMMTTEVTQGMWLEVMGSNPAFGYGVGSNYPVYNVSWNDCQEFVDVMNVLDPNYEYRLPSEAEWEYACRAGTTTRFYWGDDPSYSLIDQYAWYYENSGSITHPVAQKLPNAWGLYDMSGNVREWCEDYWHDDYTGAPTDGSPWISPSSSYRVIRGGGWINGAQSCRSAIRHCDDPGSSDYNLGLRLARSVR